MRGLVLITLVVAATATARLDGARAGPDASRVIDRTLRCTTSVQAGVRKLEVYAQSGVRESPSTWKWLASAYLGTPGTNVAGSDQWAIAGIRAGWPPPAEHPESFLPAHLWIGSGRCRSVHRSVPLTRTGLTGSDASPFRDEVTCAPTPWILVRLHAVLRRPAALRLDRPSGQWRATAPVRHAELAVRTSGGTPLAFVEVRESGASRIYTSRRCSSG
jgi:hypothetical protein